MTDKDFDDILTALCTSKWNYFHFFVFSLVGLTMPSILLSGPFLTPNINHKCKLNISDGSTILDKCHYRDSKNETKSCTSWEYESEYFPHSMTEEFNLVCDRAYLRPTYQSSYMFGNFLGAPISGFLADRFGRYKMIIIGTIVLVSSSAVYTLLSNVFIIILLRFLMGLLHSSARTTAYILCLEISEQKNRSATAILLGCPWVFGVALYGILGYFVRNWRWLQRIELIPAIIALLLLRYYSESPRWLIVTGKFDEALEVLKYAAKTNGSTLPPDDEIITRMKAIQISSLSEQRRGEADSSIKESIINGVSRIAVIFKTPAMRRLTLLMYITFFSASLVYYGLTLSATNLDLNPYMYMIIGGLTELPASSPVLISVVNKFGLIIPATTSFIACGVAILALIFVSNEMKWLITILALSGRALISVAFTMLYIIAPESYPTEVRMQGIGTSQLVGRMGSIAAPYITDVVSVAHTSIPSLIFGVTSIIAGGFAYLVPDTKNSHMSETIAALEIKHLKSKPKEKPDSIAKQYIIDDDDELEELLNEENT